MRFRLSMRHAADRKSWTAKVLVASMSITTLAAQTPALSTAYVPTGTAPAVRQEVSPDIAQLRLLVGRSAVINALRPIARLSLTTAEVADALITAPQQVLVHGKAPGTISLLLWDKAGNIATYEVVVERDITLLEEQVRQLFPGEPITVRVNGRDIVLAGTVSSKYMVEKAAEVASGYVEKKEQIVNLLRQDEGASSNQIMLRVRFAEVSRSALSELGASILSSSHKGVVGRSTTQQYPAPTFNDDNGVIKTVVSDFLNVFLFDLESSLGVAIKALTARGLFQSLAEPNLIAQNGKEASFLAGGEYPYPAVQGSGAQLAITVLFKEYGIRLNFTPTVLRDDIIHLKVRPEVSSLDFTNAVSVQGFRVPSLTTRRAETEVELRDGQTFAIAGLLNNNLTQTLQKVPGIGDIPILGLLFRSKALQKNESELVVMITPQILRRNSTGVASELPRMDHQFLQRPPNTIPMPPPYLPDQRNRPTAGAAPASPASAPAVAPPADSTPNVVTSPASSASPAMPSAPSPLAAQPSSLAVPPALTPPPDAQPSPAPSSDALTKLRAASATRQLTKDEKRALDRLQEAEMLAEREATARAAAAAQSAAEQAERDRTVQAELQKKAAEQAERDRKDQGEQQKKAARQNGRNARAQAARQKKASEQAAAQARRDGREAAEQAEKAAERAAEQNKKSAAQAARDEKVEAEQQKKAAEQAAERAQRDRKAQAELQKRAAEQAKRDAEALAKLQKRAAEQQRRAQR